PAPAGQLGRLEAAGHRPHPAPHVAPAHLVAALDGGDAELAIAGQAVLDQRPVAGLEDVQRQVGEGQQHRPEGKHREASARHPPSIRSATRGTPPNPPASYDRGVSTRPEMRYVVCIPDAAADEPLAELGGRTPLEAAAMPNLARLAAAG